LLPTRSQEEEAGTSEAIEQAGGGGQDETEAQERRFGFVIRSRRSSLEFMVILDRVRENAHLDNEWQILPIQLIQRGWLTPHIVHSMLLGPPGD